MEWPVSVRDPHGRLVLRTLHVDDAMEFMLLREANRDHLGPWEPSMPAGAGERPTVTFADYVRGQARDAREGTLIPFAIELDGELVGQVHIGDIVGGSQLSGACGYWVSRHVGGRGVGTRAVALALDWALTEGGLHRVEVNIRVENVPSLALALRIRLRDEGIRERYIHVGGRWCDHRSFAVTVEELPEDGLVSRVPLIL